MKHSTISGSNSTSTWFSDILGCIPDVPYEGNRISAGGSVPFVDFSRPLYTLKIIDTYIQDNGNPWANVTNTFPPFNVSIHVETGALKFEYALAGIKKENISLSYKDGNLVLKIAKDEETKTQEWKLVRTGIKQSTSGKYKYVVDGDKYDIDKASTKWNEGVLIVEIPVNENRKPKAIAIT
jgi:HSP20 family molecular chaperone IbpA